MGFGREVPPTVDVPDAGAYLWQWFWDLRNTINGHEQPLSYRDLQAWREVTGYLSTPRDYDILIAMDVAFRNAAQAVAKENTALMQRGKGKNG